MQVTVNQHIVVAKMLIAPLGVAALLYWVTQEQTFNQDLNLTYLVAGALLALTSVIPFACRLREVLKIIGFEISATNTLRVLTQSMFYYFFVPLSVGTEVSKFAKLANLRPRYSKRKLATGIVIDHIVGLAMLIVVSAGLYVAIDPIVVRIKLAALIVVACACVLLIGGAAFYLIKKRKTGIQQLLALMIAHKSHIAIAACYSLMMHLLIAAAVFVGATHWAIEISYLQILFVLTGAFLFQMVPLNIVGVGAIEIAGAGLYLAVGLTGPQALTLVSLLYCYRILIAMVGGLWEFISGWRDHHAKVSID